MSSKQKVQRIDTVQQELDMLQRRFRDMEAKHRLLNDDSIQTIRMQRSKINKLKTDNQRLKDELALEARQAKMALSSRKSCLNSTSAATLSNAIESGEMYQRKIEIEKRRISELDIQISKMSESILQQRSSMGGLNANRETSRTIQKNIRMLENRLDKALVKYNEALGHNKKLRGTIDNLRRERVVFDGIYRKLEGDLLSIKNEMANIIADANSAYESRDSSQAEMLRLKEEADKEQKSFEHEWRELTKLIDQDRKMKDLKNNIDGDIKQDAVVTTVLEQEQQLRKKLSKGAWQIVKDKAHIHMAHEKVRNYKDAFERIKSSTGITNMDNLVNTFIESEEINFKLFNQVNKLTNQIERYEESINNFKNEIDRISNGVNPENNNQRKIIIQDLKNKIKGTNDKTEYYRTKHSESLKTMSCLKSGIEKILNAIGADDNMKHMIRNNGITQSNIMEILACIEHKTNDLISESSTIDNSNNNSMINNSDIVLDDKQAESAALGVGIGAASFKPLVVIPSSILDDFSDASDDDNNNTNNNNNNNIDQKSFAAPIINK